MSADRTVHARTPVGNEIVRYGRAGKWFYEAAQGGRRRINLAEAVRLAAQPGARVYAGRSGGGAFDLAVKRAKGTSDAA